MGSGPDLRRSHEVQRVIEGADPGLRSETRSIQCHGFLPEAHCRLWIKLVA
jgi:hypothetical protein